MCGKAVLENSRTSEYVTGQYKTQEICDRLVSKDLFMLKYCDDTYKTQETINNKIV